MLMRNFLENKFKDKKKLKLFLCDTKKTELFGAKNLK